MDRKDKEQALFRQLTLRKLKEESSTSIKNFNNYRITMTGNSGNMRICYCLYY